MCTPVNKATGVIETRSQHATEGPWATTYRQKMTPDHAWWEPWGLPLWLLVAVHALGHDVHSAKVRQRTWGSPVRPHRAAFCLMPLPSPRMSVQACGFDPPNDLQGGGLIQSTAIPPRIWGFEKDARSSAACLSPCQSYSAQWIIAPFSVAQLFGPFCCLPLRIGEEVHLDFLRHSLKEGSHHLYLDSPEDSLQGSLNIGA